MGQDTRDWQDLIPEIPMKRLSEVREVVGQVEVPDAGDVDAQAWQAAAKEAQAQAEAIAHERDRLRHELDEAQRRSGTQAVGVGSDGREALATLSAKLTFAFRDYASVTGRYPSRRCAKDLVDVVLDLLLTEAVIAEDEGF